MLEDMLLVDFDPFARESRIMIVENGVRTMMAVSSDINNLAKEIPSYCEKYNQYRVRFHAPVNAYYELKRQLEEVEKNAYGETKIELEIC